MSQQGQRHDILNTNGAVHYAQNPQSNQQNQMQDINYIQQQQIQQLAQIQKQQMQEFMQRMQQNPNQNSYQQQPQQPQQQNSYETIYINPTSYQQQQPQLQQPQQQHQEPQKSIQSQQLNKNSYQPQQVQTNQIQQHQFQQKQQLQHQQQAKNNNLLLNVNRKPLRAINNNGNINNIIRLPSKVAHNINALPLNVPNSDNHTKKIINSGGHNFGGDNNTFLFNTNASNNKQPQQNIIDLTTEKTSRAKPVISSVSNSNNSNNSNLLKHKYSRNVHWALDLLFKWLNHTDLENFLQEYPPTTDDTILQEAVSAVIGRICSQNGQPNCTPKKKSKLAKTRKKEHKDPLSILSVWNRKFHNNLLETTMVEMGLIRIMCDDAIDGTDHTHRSKMLCLQCQTLIWYNGPSVLYYHFNRARTKTETKWDAYHHTAIYDILQYVFLYAYSQ